MMLLMMDYNGLVISINRLFMMELLTGLHFVFPEEKFCVR